MTAQHIIASIIALAVSATTVTKLAHGQESGAVEGTLEVLGEYERIRALLAADSGTRVPHVARRVATRARAAERAATGPLADHLGAVADAAQRLAGVSGSDLPTLRRGFGALSQPLVAILGVLPAAARGRHVFNCPMARGYGQWIQLNRILANSYMGSRMLRCGMPVE